MKETRLEIIHESLVNGQRKQMVDQIDMYGLYDFWEDYSQYLYSMYNVVSAYEYLTDAIKSYHRIKER
jgi:hypothetical protein